MRKVWICTLLVPFVLSLTTSEAAQEPEQSGFQVVSTDAEYLGPIPSDAVNSGAEGAERWVTRRLQRLDQLQATKAEAQSPDNRSLLPNLYRPLQCGLVRHISLQPRQ